MTENEAINYYKKAMQIHKDEFGDDQKAVDLYNTTINALRELQQYRAIGTVEECREARGKRIKKKPNIWGDGYDSEGKMIYDMYDCLNCGKSYEIDYSDYDYCPNCGQAFDRSDIPK